MGGLGNMISNMFWSSSTQAPRPIQSSKLTITPGGTTNMLGGSIYAPPPPAMHSMSDLNLSRLEGYVEMCGDTLEYIRVSKNIETKDPKISILKLATDGEFIKNVGLKYNENTYYIIREKE